MKTILIFVLAFAACVASGYLLHLYKKSRRYNTGCSSAELEATEFCVADYLDRIEAAAIRLWEEQEPLDTTITLWWGLDGLKRSENGKLEWVNRAREKSPKTVTHLNGCFDISWNYEKIGNTLRISKNATMRPLFRMCDVENDIDR